MTVEELRGRLDAFHPDWPIGFRLWESADIDRIACSVGIGLTMDQIDMVLHIITNLDKGIAISDELIAEYIQELAGPDAPEPDTF